MPRTQRVALYIQQLAFETLFQQERDERPEDVAPRAPEPASNYASWSPTSFSDYVPFRGPTNS